MGARSTQGRGPGLNKSDGHLLKYLRDSFTAGGGASITGTPSGASGGDQVVDYNGYRIHVFKTTGQSTFIVNNPISAYVMAVGGGGGGTSMRGGGSGAGGCVLRDPGHPNGLLSFSPGSWSITVGAGGAGGSGGFDNSNNDAQGETGGSTIIDSPSTLIAGGGGSGAGGWSGHTGIGAQSSPHGSGGGGGESGVGGGSGNHPSPAPIYAKGTGGGDGPAPNGGAGGGGWNAKGGDGAGGDGGLGRQIPSIFRSPQITGIGVPGINGEEWWVGGGGGGYGDSASGSGGSGGGGDGNGTGPAITGPIAGRPGTGGGGGGAGSGNTGGSGGSGFVLIAYQIN